MARFAMNAGLVYSASEIAGTDEKTVYDKVCNYVSDLNGMLDVGCLHSVI